MKTNIFLIAIFSFIFYSSVNAQIKGTGLGMSFGEPTAFDMKSWVSENSAIEVKVGSSLATEYYRLSLSADYVYHAFDMINSRSKLPVYYGFGIGAASRSDGPMRYGIRGVVGIMWYTHRFPIDMYIQTSPTIHLTPQSSFWFNLSAGFRYFFNKEN